MKKLVIILAALVLCCAVSCEEQGNETKIPDDAYISLNKETVAFSPDGGSTDIKVYSNYEWKLTNNCDWITTSETGGEASDDGTTITLTADLTYDDREGTILFSCGKAIKPLIVSQSLKEVIIADENNTFNIPAEGGSATIAYQTSVECEVVIPEEAKSWITITPSDATRGLVAESVKLGIAENSTYGERRAVVKVIKVGDNTLCAEYTILQVQNDALFNEEENTFNIHGLSQHVTIPYRTNVECEVVIPEEAQSWIMIAPKTRALVNESATLNIAENNTGAERCAVVKIIAVANSKLMTEYTISQKPRYFIEYTSVNDVTVTPYQTNAFGATYLGSTCANGKGYIDFDAPITKFGDSAFSHRSSLTSITIPDSVTSIGDFAFYECTSLTSITIPDSVTSIGNYAFSNCSKLTSVTIGNDVTSIGSYAFAYCTSLTSITIPDSVTSIGDFAFYECTSLTSITIPDSVTSIGSYAFRDCYNLPIYDNLIYADTYLVGVEDSSFVTYNIKDDTKFIGDDAFLYLDSLTSITIPDSVTSIGGTAFRGCSSLTSITIPDGVTSIEWGAFRDCTSLTSVYCKPTTPPSGSYYMFDDNASGRKIYVPRNSVQAYKTAEYWSKYASVIEGCDF